MILETKRKIHHVQKQHTVTNRSTNAVVTSVTTTNNNHVLVLGAQVLFVGKVRVEQTGGVLLEELHRKVDTVELTARNVEVPGPGGASANEHDVVLGLELPAIDVLADVGVGHKLDTLGSHEVDTALNNALVELHVGDTVHEQSTNAVIAVVDGHGVASLVELVSGRKTGRAGTNDGNALASAELGRGRNDPALLESTVNDGGFDRLDRDGELVDTEHASTLARSRADTTSELREVVGHEQTLESLLPLVLEDEVVPLGNDVADGATSVGLTERHTAVWKKQGKRKPLGTQKQKATKQTARANTYPCNEQPARGGPRHRDVR